jgi:hypothetical protein
MMTYLPRIAAANSAGWLDLVEELDRWEEAGRVAQLWWRDDDAIAPTPELDRLLTVADCVPLGLAVIPGDVVGEMAAALDPFPQISVLQHGWCHANWAANYPGAGKSSEYPAARHPVDVADELEEGRRRLLSLFGPRALRVFVPPWNRFSDRFVPLLGEAGFAAISQMAPRETAPLRRDISGGVPGEIPRKRPGVARIDVHLDIVAWHEDRKFVGDAVALGGLVAELRARRGAGDDTAIGLLTHHLVMDGPTEDFLYRLGEIVAAHRAVRWSDVRELMVVS